jgi:flagellar biosynthetic protein FliR
MDALVATWLLVFVRTVSLIVALPVFATLGVPRAVPVLTALGVTVLIAPGVEVVPLAMDRSLILAVAYEVAVGSLAGLSIRVIFTGLALAGEVMSLQMGLAMAQLLDPMQRTQQSPVTSVANWVAGLAFIHADLHVFCLHVMSAGFAALPPGSAALTPDALQSFLDGIETVFVLGVQLAGPVLALVFLTNVLVGVLGKLAPRMNVFFSVGPTLTSIGGVLLLAVALPAVTLAVMDALEPALRSLPLYLDRP